MLTSPGLPTTAMTTGYGDAPKSMIDCASTDRLATTKSVAYCGMPADVVD
jgi:hypothetical protein